MAKNSGNTGQIQPDQPAVQAWSPSPDRIPLWKFARTLSCTLVYEKRDFVIEVDTDQGRYLSKRFKFEAQAVSHAMSLAEKMDPKQWTRVEIPLRKLRGQR